MVLPRSVVEELGEYHILFLLNQHELLFLFGFFDVPF